jgi:hypothetical protein
MTLNPYQLCRYALAVLWLFTAATSFWWGRQIGYEVLALQHIQGELADACIAAGSLLDAAVGLWLLSGYKSKRCYKAQIAIIGVYSLLLTIIAPDFWLHPFGPLTKNIPIVALLVLLHQKES